MGVKVVAGWDHDKDRAAGNCANFGLDNEPTAEGLLARSDIGAVVIAAETSMHADLVELAAKAGKAIVVQKPIALEMDEVATSKQGGALLARFFLDGSDDTAFNANGWIYITHPGVAIQLQGVTQLNSGLILVYGKTEVTHQGWIMAFDNAGQVAKSFGNDGTLLLNIRNEGTPLESSVNGIVEQSAQRLLLIGAAVEAAGGEKRQHAFMTGITHGGEIDPSFNGGAPVLSASTQPQELKSWVAGFAVGDSADQRIVTVGQTSGGHRNLLTGGFLKDGAVDESFDLEGTAEIDWIARDACLQDASVVVLGTKNESAQLIRLLTHS